MMRAALTAAGLAAMLLGLVQLAPAQEAPAAQPNGAALFQSHCAVCHGAKGLGQPSLAPPLTSNPARYATIPEGRRQLASTALYGMFGRIDVDGKHFDFKMPEFAQFDDATLAAVLNYVVFDLAKAPETTKPLIPDDIKSARTPPMTGAEVREQRAKVLALLGL
jgi:mono/diheme cytochrome c family protein